MTKDVVLKALFTTLHGQTGVWALLVYLFWILLAVWGLASLVVALFLRIFFSLLLFRF